MRQLSCKRLSIFLINLCFFVFLANAQDSSKVAKQPSSSTATKKATKHPVNGSTSVKSGTATITQPAKSGTPSTTTNASSTVQAPVKPVVTGPAGPVDHSLNGQYQDLLKYSWMQKGYKVIQPARLTSLWKSVTDSINYTKKQLAEVNIKLDQQIKQIAELRNTDTKSAPANNSSVERTVSSDQIQVLGMTIDTSTYNWIVWGTIIALVLALAGVLFTTTKNSIDAKNHKQLYEEISLEYQTYKTKAKEKELKLARELQTERNTIEDLLAKKNETEANRRSKK